MTHQEIIELEAWIYENVMVWVPVEFHPCSSKSDALDVLEKCAKKIDSDKTDDPISIRFRFSTWYVSAWPTSAIEVESDTLPLAICLFAKQLYTKL